MAKHFVMLLTVLPLGCGSVQADSDEPTASGSEAVDASPSVEPVANRIPADASAPTRSDAASIGPADMRGADPAPAPAADAGLARGKLTDVTAGLPKNVKVFAALPGKNRVIALVGQEKPPGSTWATTDGGATWVEIGKGAGSLPLSMVPLGITLDPDNPDVFWTFGNWTGGSTGILKTTDGGNTWLNGHGYETEGVSVDFTDPQRKTLVYGQHEAHQAVNRSSNGGQSWTPIGKTLPAGTALTEYPLVLDASTFLIGCSFMVSYGTGTAEGTPGIFRTADGGATWTKVSDRSVFQNPLLTGGKIYWTYYNSTTKDGGLLRSDDKGATWTVATASGLRYTVTPIALSGGRVAMMTSNKLVTVSSDGGVTWKNISTPVTLANPWGLTYSAALDAYFAWEINGHVQRLDATP